MDIIDKRFVKEADMLNMMPVDLRDKIMEILIPKWRQPANNVSLLYNEEIKVFKVTYVQACFTNLFLNLVLYILTSLANYLLAY